MTERELTLLRGIAVEPMARKWVHCAALSAAAATLFGLGLILEHDDTVRATDLGRVVVDFCERFRTNVAASISEEEWATLRAAGGPR